MSRTLGWLALLFGFVVAIQILLSPQIIVNLGLTELGLNFDAPWLISLAMAIGGTLYAILFWGLAEVIQLGLSIERNTRKLHELLDKK